MDGKSSVYITLKGEGSAEFEEKKSLFIGNAKHVETEDEAMDFIKSVKKQYPDATHNCWGYILKRGIIARYSDDGEPQGTAGLPILESIRKNGVDDAVVVVTRYFGGILLGAGGLVRAYSHAAKIGLEAAEIVTYEKYTEFTLECSYADHRRLMSVFPSYGVITDDTEFCDFVHMRLAVKRSLFDSLCAKINEFSGGRCHAENISERFDYR